jgi:hypothetical protein
MLHAAGVTCSVSLKGGGHSSDIFALDIVRQGAPAVRTCEQQCTLLSTAAERDAAGIVNVTAAKAHCGSGGGGVRRVSAGEVDRWVLHHCMKGSDRGALSLPLGLVVRLPV